MKLSIGLPVKHERSPTRFDIDPPSWVFDWMSAKAGPMAVGDLSLTHRGLGPTASLMSLTLSDAASLAADEFERRTIEIFESLRRGLALSEHAAPVRFWNYLPAIHEPMDERRDRYMVFNAARFKAMSDWFGGPAHLPGRLPAASGVGHGGRDLVVHCLSCAQAGEAVENPRQIPAFEYSEKYGPLPPCFARATVIAHDGGRALLIAGTASIVGEQSVHPDDLPKQLDETLANLHALVDAAPAGEEPWALRDVRAYCVRQSDAPAIEQRLRAALGPAVRLEMRRADLCRAELLVEIEGLALSNGSRP